jgi:hypothetical protein
MARLRAEAAHRDDRMPTNVTAAQLFRLPEATPAPRPAPAPVPTSTPAFQPQAGTIIPQPPAPKGHPFPTSTSAQPPDGTRSRTIAQPPAQAPFHMTKARWTGLLLGGGAIGGLSALLLRPAVIASSPALEQHPVLAGAALLAGTTLVGLGMVSFVQHRVHDTSQH